MPLKKERMNSTQRIDALLNLRRLDRVPVNMISIGFSSRNAGQSIRTAYDDPENSFNAMLWTAEQYDWDLIPQSCAHTVLGALDFGGEYRLPKSEYDGAIIIESFPANTERDIDRLEMPDPRRAGRIEKAMEFARLQKAHGLPVSFVSRSPLSMGSNICGLEQFCKWMIKKPEICERLILMSIDHIFNVLQYWVDTFSSDNIFVLLTSPCESNQVISPKQFEKFALPYHKEYHDRLRAMHIERFFFHICGDQNRNLPSLADLSPWPHPSILSFGHEVDLEVAAKFFPDDVIYGNVEPAVIQARTAEQVYELSKVAIEKGKKAQGSFVLSAGCELPPAAPPANVFAMTKAVNDFGWY